MPSALRPVIDEMFQAMRVHDLKRCQKLHAKMFRRAQRLGPDELTAVIEDLVPRIDAVVGVFSMVAVLTGALVELGGSPLPMREVLPSRAIRAMTNRKAFPDAWQVVSGGQPLPEGRGMGEVADLFEARTEGLRLSRNEAIVLGLSWFDARDWIKSMITVMAYREFRAAVTEEVRGQIRDAAAAIAKDVDGANWLQGLAMVLDDEPLVVLDPGSRRGFRLTMSGIGDNYQLHTLLADRLSGKGVGLPGIEPPLAAWVSAATTGPNKAFQATDPIVRRMRLFDGNGAYVYPEGRPVDIGLLNGTRVLVVHPPLGSFGWAYGRAYPHMVPALTLDAELSADEAATWLARVAPANETDLMGVNARH